MAKLYPPIILGTIPSFYRQGTTTTIVVPFSMNKTVSAEEVRNFKLRIKTVNTDSLVLEIESKIEETGFFINNGQIVFQFTGALDTYKMIEGTFYKLQIAYINNEESEVGYFSTVGTAKFTKKPTVTIAEFSSSQINFNTSLLIGKYKNADSTEKVSEYCFTLTDENGTIIETSNWQKHNSYQNESIDVSTDFYSIVSTLESGKVYKIQYFIRTINGLEVSSPKYSLQVIEEIDAQIKGYLNAKLNARTASVSVYLYPTITEGEVNRISGTFILSRASSNTNFTSWTEVCSLFLTGDYPTEALFTDYTVESGLTYRYALQQVNDYGVRSNKNIRADILVGFEDAYLYDGERQLKLQFNPKVTSFKEVVSETKKSTIGAQYPFFFRNGIIKYREFPIAGLISYLMDEQETFLKKEEVGYDGWIDTTDYSDQNIALERIFKLKVLEWLNNGKPKLFRSAQEGNYIVRLMNVSLSPFDKTTRMIHSFSCQATEVAEADPKNFIDYNFLTVKEISATEKQWQTILLKDYVEKNKTNITFANGVGHWISGQEQDIFNGNTGYHIKFTNVLPGTTFTLNGEVIQIGATGQYEAKIPEGIHGLILNDFYSNMSGELTYCITNQIANQFNAIQGYTLRNVVGHCIIGEKNKDEIFYGSIIDSLHEVPKMYMMSFHRKEQEILNDTFDNLNAISSDNRKKLFNVYTIYYLKPEKVYCVYDIATNKLKKVPNIMDENGEKIDVKTLITKVEIKDKTISINGSKPKERIMSFDINETGERHFKNLNTLIQNIQIGAGVYAVLSYQQREINYEIDDNDIKTAYKAYRAELWRYNARFFHFTDSVQNNPPYSTPCIKWNVKQNMMEYNEDGDIYCRETPFTEKEIDDTRDLCNNLYIEYRTLVEQYLLTLEEEIKKEGETS